MKHTTNFLRLSAILTILLYASIAFSNDNQGYIQTAYNAMKAKKYEAAIENYSSAISAFDTYAPAYYGRGLAYFNKENYDNATIDFKKALKIQPDYFEAYYALGMVEMQKDDHKKAVEYLDQCLSISNAFPEAYYARASSWYRMKNYDKALVDYNKTIQLQPSYALAYYGRGITNKMQGLNGRAIEDWEQYKKLAGNMHGLSAEVERLIKESSSAEIE